jgi:glycosyltransferase involved in cell wall biosynthesis
MTDYPPIATWPAGQARPFWSVMIPTYEPNPDYLARTLVAVLEQDPGPATMEIALVDDGSRTVDPRESVPAGARDRVSWFPGQRHAGIGRNWNACIEHARGQWVHILHQDDLVLDGFYERLRAGIASAPAVGAAFCRDVIIGAEGERIGRQRFIRSTPGIVEDWIEHVFVGLDLRASALVVKRDVYEAIGGFRLDLQYALDWDMWKRIAAAYPLWYEPEPLACYRRHRGRATGTFMRTGANIAEIGRSIELSVSLLPPSVAASATSRARDYYTEYAVLMAWRALTEGDLRSSLAQIRNARGLTSTVKVAREIVRLCAHGVRPPSSTVRA